ncbi:hypothetical protein [Methanobacterium formicicum]|uniref:Uncharacterized protein n=1 Tax=Methanobacterium formicicum (strain DSM 3637 / PP1) TaxID=1204725 RepID=K2RUM5_METFP|nr:hypothetical protein [Methanobacterium formicicum]EKF86465.1 hypothetical protein A994_03243 [Methanobacterium formicicum DSM 3637]
MKILHIGLLVLVIGLVAVSGCTSSNNSNSNSNGNSSSSNASASNDVNIVVSYSGSWAVDVSGPFGYRSLSGTGDQTNNIGSVTGSVTAAARKTEGGNGLLTVSITKGGKTLASQSTSAPWGGATAVATGI